MPLKCPQSGCDQPEVFPGFSDVAGFPFAESLEANCQAIPQEFLGLDEFARKLIAEEVERYGCASDYKFITAD